MNEGSSMLKDIATSASMGVLGITARHMIDKEKRSLAEIALRTGAAMITAIFVGFAADAFLENESLKYAAVGALSYTAPEVLGYLVKFVNRKGSKFIK